MKLTQLLSVFSFILLFTIAGITQNTVGLLSYDPSKSFEGYNLFFPHNQADVFLVNNCGELVHSWTDDDEFRPGNAVYLLDNGNLIKCKRSNLTVDDPIGAGGKGAIVELRDWDNNLLWSYEKNDSKARLHHDVAPMPNGNMLMLAWEKKTAEEAIAAGRDTGLLVQGELWPDYIFEVNPQTDSIVWEWHVWDHLIQDYDPQKANFGVIEDHPELVDVNWTENGEGIADWMHSNAIDYNPELDQIVLSVPFFNEIWVIDHSTTTEEAAGHSGGASGRGGDLMYRWGNPQAFGSGGPENQTLHFQHDIHWIRDFIDPSHAHYGKMAVFNNRVNPDYSSVSIFNPGFGWGSWSYPQIGDQWGPVGFDLTKTHPDPEKFFSAGLSSVQLLPNDNILMCAGIIGYSVECTPENEIVWEYITPLSGGNPVSQGETLTGGNLTFRMKKYPANYLAFEGRDLSPKGFIELNPNVDQCNTITSTQQVDNSLPTLVFPNPATSKVLVENSAEIGFFEIFDFSGKKMMANEVGDSHIEIDVTNWPSGLYLIKINGKEVRKLAVHH